MDGHGTTNYKEKDKTAGADHVHSSLLFSVHICSRLSELTHTHLVDLAPDACITVELSRAKKAMKKGGRNMSN